MTLQSPEKLRCEAEPVRYGTKEPCPVAIGTVEPSGSLQGNPVCSERVQVLECGAVGVTQKGPPRIASSEGAPGILDIPASRGRMWGPSTPNPDEGAALLLSMENKIKIGDSYRCRNFGVIHELVYMTESEAVLKEEFGGFLRVVSLFLIGTLYEAVALHAEIQDEAEKV